MRDKNSPNVQVNTLIAGGKTNGGIQSKYAKKMLRTEISVERLAINLNLSETNNPSLVSYVLN